MARRADGRRKVCPGGGTRVLAFLFSGRGVSDGVAGLASSGNSRRIRKPGSARNGTQDVKSFRYGSI